RVIPENIRPRYCLPGPFHMDPLKARFPHEVPDPHRLVEVAPLACCDAQDLPHPDHRGRDRATGRTHLMADESGAGRHAPTTLQRPDTRSFLPGVDGRA